MEEALEAEEICPLHADFEPAMFQPYVLDLGDNGVDLGVEISGLSFLVLMRDGGMT